MSAMHHDTSPDLRVIGSKLNDILEVRIKFPSWSQLIATLGHLSFFRFMM